MNKAYIFFKRIILAAGITAAVTAGASAFEVEYDVESESARETKKVHSESSKIVVTGTKTKKHQKEAPVKTDLLGRERIEAKGADNIFEALNGETGVVAGNNCQNCGANEVVMNGLSGNYTQILFNGVPAVSSLAGVYFLQQYPAELIDRVEIVRGGGSALYGSGAIGGVINVITKKPLTNSAYVSYRHEVLDGYDSFAHTVSGLASAVSSDAKAGIAVFGSKNERDEWDANNDGYSDLSRSVSKTFGASGFFSFGKGRELSYNAYTLHDDRAGGNNLDLEPFQSNIREQAKTNRDAADLRFEHEISNSLNYLVFSSFSRSFRQTYYGPAADPSDPANLADNVNLFGRTENPYLINGFSVNYSPVKNHTITAGYEFSRDRVEDVNPGMGREIDVTYLNNGAVFQYDWNSEVMNLVAGFRADKHSEIDTIILSPRANLLFRLGEHYRLRGGAATGFKAPQVFDEDFHIEVSLADSTGRNKVIVNNSDISEERSVSYSGDLAGDFHLAEGMLLEFSIGGFYTQIWDKLEVDYSAPTSTSGNIDYYQRDNVKGVSKVAGANIEAVLFSTDDWSFSSGATWIPLAKLSSKDEYLNGENDDMLKVPVVTAYSMAQYKYRNFAGSMSAQYIGRQKLSHNVGHLSANRLEETDDFIVLGTRFTYKHKLSGTNYIDFFGGVDNITNSYQEDLDKGDTRDAGYIYGPVKPRSFYAGARAGF